MAKGKNKNQDATVERVIYSTQDYEIRVTSILEPESSNRLPVYGIFNKVHGVREAEVRAYPAAVTWADTLQTQVNEMYAARAAESAEEELMAEALGGATPTEEEVAAIEPMSSDEAEAFLDSVALPPTEAPEGDDDNSGDAG